MALKNRSENVPAASLGVRNDVDAFNTPQGALQIGRNVINTDGSLRVRMAHEDLSFVALSVGTPVDSADDLSKAFVRLTGTDIVHDGFGTDLSEPDKSTAGNLFGEGYIASSPDIWYRASKGPTSISIQSFTDKFSTSPGTTFYVLEPYGVEFEDFGIFGGMLWANDENSTGLYYATIVAGGSETASWSTGYHSFGGGTFGNGDGVLVANGFARLITNGALSMFLEAPWVNESVAANSAYFTNSDGNVVQVYVDPNEDAINVIEWINNNGVLNHRTINRIEGSFVQEKIYAVGSLTEGQVVVWHETSKLLFASTNDGNTFMSSIDWTGYDDVLGIYGSDVYLLKGTTDVWYIPLFSVSSANEAVSVFQFDADDDDKMIVAAIDEDLYYIDGGAVTLIGDLGGTLNTNTQVSRSARPVFRTFETGAKTHLIWTDVKHGVSGWVSDDPGVPPISASGVSGGRGLMVLANRALKLGGEDEAAIEVDVSDFNDWQNGWGTVEVALLGDTPGKITGGSEISALQGAIFKEDAILHAIAQVEFGGVAAPFRFEQILAGINGPMSQHAILKTTEGYSMFLGRDGGVYVYDGARVHDLGRHVRNLVEGKLDFMFIEEAWGVFNPVKNLALFVYPSIGDRALNRGVIVDAKSGSAWEVTLGDELEMTCGAHVIYEKEMTIGEVGMRFGEGRRIALQDFDTEDRMVMSCFADGRWAKQVWEASDGSLHTDMGTAIDVEWETGALAMSGLPHQFKTVQEGFHTFGKLDEELSIQMNRYDRNLDKVKGAIRSVRPGSFKTSHRETGRMFTLRGSGSITRNFEYVMSTISHRVRGQR